MASIHKFIGEILRAGARLAADRDALLLSYGVTGAGLRLLKTIRMIRRPMSVTALARAMSVSRQTVRETARGLCLQGFIAMEIDPWNPRAFLVTLTESGKEMLELLMRYERRWVAGLARGISEPLRAQTVWVLRNVRERRSAMPRSLEQADPRPPVFSRQPVARSDPGNRARADDG